jgi:uncharacterized protein YndB with AHSA1/START domain
MPCAVATRTLLAPREDVWAFVSDPHRLPDWWPGIVAVTPDRRGFAAGARWQVRAGERPGLLRKPYSSGQLLVRETSPPASASWHLTGDRLDVAIALDEDEPGRTTVTLEIRAPWNVQFRRKLPQHALARLYDLCQTAAPAG